MKAMKKLSHWKWNARMCGRANESLFPKMGQSCSSVDLKDWRGSTAQAPMRGTPSSPMTTG